MTAPLWHAGERVPLTVRLPRRDSAAQHDRARVVEAAEVASGILVVDDDVSWGPGHQPGQPQERSRAPGTGSQRIMRAHPSRRQRTDFLGNSAVQRDQATRTPTTDAQHTRSCPTWPWGPESAWSPAHAYPGEVRGGCALQSGCSSLSDAS